MTSTSPAGPRPTTSQPHRAVGRRAGNAPRTIARHRRVGRSSRSARPGRGHRRTRGWSPAPSPAASTDHLGHGRVHRMGTPADEGQQREPPRRARSTTAARSSAIRAASNGHCAPTRRRPAGGGRAPDPAPASATDGRAARIASCPSSMPRLKPKQRDRDRAGEEAAAGSWRSRRRAPARRRRRRPAGSGHASGARSRSRTSRFSVAVARMVTGMRNSIERRRQPDRARDRERERDRVAHGERGDHPERVAPVAAAVDRGEREEEEHVVQRRRVGDVVQAELDEGGELAHGTLRPERRRRSARASSGWVGCHSGLIASAVLEPAAWRGPCPRRRRRSCRRDSRVIASRVPSASARRRRGAPRQRVPDRWSAQARRSQP